MTSPRILCIAITLQCPTSRAMPSKRLPLPGWLRVKIIGLIVGHCDSAEHTATIIEYLIEENRCLRAQIPGRVKLTWPERLRLSALGRRLGVQRLKAICSIADPKTVIGWIKRWQNGQINRADERRPGRPAISDELRAAILDLHDRGFTTIRGIRGQLRKCDLSVAASTIHRVLRDAGRPTGPTQRSTWRDFWRRHADALVGIDFLTVPVGLLGKVVNYHILIGIEHDSRRLHLLGMTPHPDALFMAQVAREATAFDGPLADRRFAIIDNDSLYTRQFRGILTDAGCEPVRTSLLAPNMNAYAERVIRSIKEECLDHFVFLNERMLRRAITAYIEHYNQDRPHQGLDLQTIEPWPHHGNPGEIVVDERLGGLLKSARRLAA